MKESGAGIGWEGAGYTRRRLKATRFLSRVHVCWSGGGGVDLGTGSWRTQGNFTGGALEAVQFKIDA